MWQGRCTALAEVGILSAVAMGFGSLPMVFDFNLAVWFNHHYVTTDVPEPEDLETWLEVCTSRHHRSIRIGRVCSRAACT